MTSKNKKTILFGVLMCSVLAIGGVTALTASVNKGLFYFGETKTYQLKINKDKNKFYTSSTSPITGTVSCKTEEGNNVSVAFCNVVKYDDGVAELVDEHSSIYNNSAILGLASIDVVVDSEMVAFYIDWSNTSSFLPGETKSFQCYSLMAGSGFYSNFNDDLPTYFRVRSDGDSIKVTSIVVSYTCTE